MPAKPVTPPLHPLLPHGPEDFDFQQVIKSALPRSGDTAETLSFLDNYDRAMKQWVQGVLYWDGRFLPIVFASPLRAFSEMRSMLSDDPNAMIPAPADAQLDYPGIPLPFVSFWRGDIRFGPRLNQNYPVRNIGFLDGTGKRRTGTMRFPMSVNIPYQVEVWCKSYTTQGILIQQLMTQFWSRMAYWSVNTPYGRPIYMPIRMVGQSDTSELEAGADAKDRILRYTFQLEVEGKVFFDVMSAPTYMRKDVLLQVQNSDGTVIEADHALVSTDVASEVDPANPAPPSLEERDASVTYDAPSEEL